MAVNRLTRDEKQAQTRAALLDAAVAVFLRRGFAGSSVEEIAAEAGFTRGAFYSNFASKEQLFVELLHERVFSVYRSMVEERLAGAQELESAREGGAELARVQRAPHPDWLFPLWLEVLAQAGRDPGIRELAATFWSGTRTLLAELLRRTQAEHGADPSVDPQAIAVAVIALNIGIAVQHHVDPDNVPLDLYPELFELLLGPLQPGAAD